MGRYYFAFHYYKFSTFSRVQTERRNIQNTFTRDQTITTPDDSNNRKRYSSSVRPVKRDFRMLRGRTHATVFRQCILNRMGPNDVFRCGMAFIFFAEYHARRDAPWHTTVFAQNRIYQMFNILKWRDTRAAYVWLGSHFDISRNVAY